MELGIGLRINNSWRTVLARVSGLVYSISRRRNTVGQGHFGGSGDYEKLISAEKIKKDRPTDEWVNIAGCSVPCDYKIDSSLSVRPRGY